MLFVATLSATLAVTPVSAELADVMVRDESIRACAADSRESPQNYIAGAFDVRRVRLRTGQKMMVAVAKDPCLALGQSTRLLIFEEGAAGYRRVLDEPTLPDLARVDSDGTVTVPTHESMEVIFEATYVWNGSRYALSPLRSHEYDVALSQRRPYERPVNFAHGESAAVLSGTVALNFGDMYVFEALAGERVTIGLSAYTGRRPMVSLFFGNETPAIVELGSSSSWTGRLPKSGRYHLLVSGTDEREEKRRSSYSIRLSIGR